MKLNSHFKNILLLNLAMLAISTSGPLGRAITMPPVTTIFWRAVATVFILLLYCRWHRHSLRIHSRRATLIIVGSGILLGLHWVTYFHALQLSNVAIGMLSLFTFPIFTAFIEPLLTKARFQPAHLFLGLLTLVGMYFLVPEIDPANTQFQAVGWGTLSAFCYALRNVLMKNQVTNYSGTVLMFYQIVVICLMLSPMLLFLGPGDIAQQWQPVLLLALLTTVVGHTLFLLSFKHFSITTASIMSCTQPIFGILLGAIFLKEYPSWNTYLGGGIILLVVVIESLRTRN